MPDENQRWNRSDFKRRRGMLSNDSGKPELFWDQQICSNKLLAVTRFLTSAAVWRHWREGYGADTRSSLCQLEMATGSSSSRGLHQGC
jgi:hypothetical protein